MRIAELHAQGVSMNQISRQLGIGYGTAWNYVQRLKTADGKETSPSGHTHAVKAHALAQHGENTPSAS